LRRTDDEVRIHARADGAAIELRVIPGARRTRIVGMHDGRLKVQVQAPPEGGRANRALCELLARTFGLARRDVNVELGARSRDNVVHLRGVDPSAVLRALS